MSDRAADNWEPMLAIASLIGVYGDALVAARSHIDDTESLGELLLAHVREVFVENGMPEAMSTESILRHLVDRDDGPWPRWWATLVGQDNLKSAGASLAKKLRPYRVASRKCRDGRETFRGYRRADWSPHGSPMWPKSSQIDGTTERRR